MCRGACVWRSRRIEAARNGRALMCVRMVWNGRAPDGGTAVGGGGVCEVRLPPARRLWHAHASARAVKDAHRMRLRLRYDHSRGSSAGRLLEPSPQDQRRTRVEDERQRAVKLRGLGAGGLRTLRQCIGERSRQPSRLASMHGQMCVGRTPHERRQSGQGLLRARRMTFYVF
eukprot:5372402-Prymnesium_polylepis.1